MWAFRLALAFMLCTVSVAWATPTVNSVGAIASGATAITPTVGASHSTNDIDLLFVETNNETATLSTANGFAELSACTIGTGTAKLTIFWRRWDGSAGNPTVADSGDHQIGRIMSISGAPTGQNPWGATQTSTQGSTASVSITGLTTNGANSLVLGVVTSDKPASNGTTEYTNVGSGGGWTDASLTSLTEQIDNSRNAGAGGSMGVCSGIKAAAGSVNAMTVTAANAGVRANCMLEINDIGATTTTTSSSTSSSTAVSTTSTSSSTSTSLAPSFARQRVFQW